MTMINAHDPTRTDQLPPADRALVERRAALLGPAYRLFYDTPLHVVRGEGCWLYDAQGNRYLDAYNNVASVGHCHPRVTAAMAGQAAILNTHTRYLHELLLDYAQRLLDTLPDDLGRMVFTCTGSEANDLALRIAKSESGGTGVIVTANAYHGTTELLAGMSPSLGPAMRKGQDVWMVAAPDSYRGTSLADGVAAALVQMRARNVQPAALLADTIFASDGIFPTAPGLAEAVAMVRDAGGLYIADEVQPGFGRTGKMWGIDHLGLTPDIVTMGKPMGNGYPVAGLAGRRDILDRFGQNMRYFNTFGGSPVAAAVGLAVLDVIRDQNLCQNAAAVGEYLLEGLTSLQSRHSVIGDVRGQGLYLALEFVTDGATKAPDSATALGVVNGLRDRRVLISATGPGANVLKIRPPLVFSYAEADILLRCLDECL
ncbi:aspartate aminotransferase family protein [Paracoccus sp. 11-3]|uniref:Aspartate aminotransferase family protein n=1 Tax=Paracoccus amoyensis TaxID=2760093 RepID=A0A926JCZ8_9RHOB|nr:aspartate aminotransferase family protein [Paracoccus amoyensis]MBC9246338.1 aspartate aminotransferase family protein [Paracoccus amoyensis]